MKNPVSQPSTRLRTIRLFALAAVLGLASIGLTQCRMVSDNVAGVDMTAESLHQRNRCVRHCNDAYEDAMEKEACRHRDALRKCGSSRKCKDAEKRKHADIEDAIRDARKECKGKCYNEGHGNGGR